MSLTVKPRDWCFTLFAEGAEVESALSEFILLVKQHNAVYLICQLEIAPTTGSLHFQGYVEFTNPQRMAGAVRLLPSGVRVFSRRGTKLEAIEYCEKSDTRANGDGDFGPWEFGKRPKGPGYRSDLASACEALKSSGGDVKLLTTTHPTIYVKFVRGIESLASIIRPKWNADNPRNVVILWGPTGTGKTRFARAHDPDLYMFPSPQNNGCYALGYAGEKTVCIDDFYSWLPIHFMLRLCDRYSLQVNTMGSYTEWLPTHIFITSNDDPRTWWPKTDSIARKDAFFRRVDKIIHMVTPGSGIDYGQPLSRKQETHHC